MKNEGGKKAIVVALATLAFALGSMVQELRAQVGTSSITGFVYDASGATIPDAKVVLTNPATGLERSTQTEPTGFYKFPDLPPGSYNLQVIQQGFQTYVVKALVLQIDQHVSHDVTMQLGAVTQQVTVTVGAPQLLETNSATTGQVITERTIVSLPLNGRNFLQLASLGTGATPVVLQGSFSSFATFLTARGSSTVHLGGNRESATDYLLDGIPARNDRAGNINFQLTIDTIEEFKIQRNVFPAEFGYHPGIVNVATKSGTNEIHGSIWEFLRNDNLDARNFFGKEIEPFHQNQFGLAGGGPLRKNKLFWFASYEGFRKVFSGTQTGLFPDTKQLSGDLSNSGVFGNAPIFDPSTFDPVTGTRQPFSGNVIPAGRINPFSGKAVQTLFPSVDGPPTNGGVNRIVNPRTTQVDNQFMVRGDAQDVRVLDKPTQFFGRYSQVNSVVVSQGLAPLQGLQRFQNARNVVFQAGTSWSPMSVNVFRAGYSRDFSPFAFEGARGSVNIPKELGLNNTTTDSIDFAAPNFGITGFSGTGGGFDLQTVTNRYIIADDFTHVVGKHTIKFGGEYRIVRLLEETAVFQNGVVFFTGQFTAQTRKNPATGQIETVAGTGSSVADFLLGTPNFGIAAFGSTLNHFRYHEPALFLQDDWKPRSNLTLQIGVRYEPISVPVSEEKRTYLFDFQTGTLKFPKLGNAPPGDFEKPYGEVGPRFGFAYSPGFDKKSVLRGGFGVHFDTTQQNELQFESQGPPFFNLQSFFVLSSQPIPPFVLGSNVFPDVSLPPIAAGFVPPVGTGPFTIEGIVRTPTVYQWSLDYEKAMGQSWLFEVGYAGLVGRHLSRRYDADQCSVPESLKCDLSRRPFPNLSEVFVTTNSAKSSMNSLNVRLEHRMAEGLYTLIAYRYAHSLDTDSGAAFASATQRTACLNCDYGDSNFDIRNRLVTSAIWELPVGKGKHFLSNLSGPMNLLFGGWETSAIVTFQSGPAGDITSPNLTGDSGLNLHRADCLGGDKFVSGDLRDNGLQLLNPDNFRTPVPGFFGSCGRSVFHGPGLNNTDLSILKVVPIGERRRMEFRTEFFNAWNHAQFDLPVSDTASPIFGKVTSAERGRVIQFGLKFYY